MTLRPPRAGFSLSRRLSERARAAQEPPVQEPPVQEPPVQEPPAGAASGPLAGMVEALQELVGRLAETAQAAQATQAEHGQDGPDGQTRQGTHTIDLGRGTRAVFGYTLKMGLDGVAAEPFGDVPEPRPREPKSETAKPAARQPIVDLFEEPDTIVVVAELPGAEAEHLVCRVDGTTLLIEAAGPRRYRKQVALPGPVEPAPHHTFQNGILEIRLTRVPAA